MVSLDYYGKGKNEKFTAISRECNSEKSETTKKFHGKYVHITSLDEKDEVNVSAITPSEQSR